MKRKIMTMWVLGTVSIAMAAEIVTAGELAIGSKLPLADREMKNVDGKTTTVLDVKGSRGTVVAFWCNNCPVVKAYKVRFVRLAAVYQAKGIGFIAVNANDPVTSPGDSLESMARDAKKNGYVFPYVVDEGSEMAKAMGASKTPHVFLFDAENKLAYVGGVDDSMNSPGSVKTPWLKNAMDSLVEGKIPVTQNSKAFGCSIKWYGK